MSAARFYRRQAHACLRLAQQCHDHLLAQRYSLMAQDYLELADPGHGSEPRVAPSSRPTADRSDDRA